MSSFMLSIAHYRVEGGAGRRGSKREKREKERREDCLHASVPLYYTLSFVAYLIAGGRPLGGGGGGDDGALKRGKVKDTKSSSQKREANLECRCPRGEGKGRRRKPGREGGLCSPGEGRGGGQRSRRDIHPCSPLTCGFCFKVEGRVCSRCPFP